MQETPSNKAIGIGKGPRRKRYNFPSKRASVLAVSLEEAQRLINKKK